jgi:hypothetical protein
MQNNEENKDDGSCSQVEELPDLTAQDAPAG